MIAAIILACAEHVAMIVVGRIFQGVAVSSSSWSCIGNASCALVMCYHSIVGDQSSGVACMQQPCKCIAPSSGQCLQC